MLDPDHPIVGLLRRDHRYRLDAYVFVFEALRFAQQELGMGHVGENGGEEESESNDPETVHVNHITGQQLCEAIRRYALQQYGALSKCVLNHWGVQSTSDFGEIVFNLIDIGQMRKTDNDRREDFDDVFDFNDGLREAFEPLSPESR